MPEIFEFKTRYKYPHMKPNDIVIWERFLKKYPNAYNSVQYDFPVGDPPPFNPLGNNGEDLNQDILYRLKIDVIGKLGGKKDIIEIKPNAGPSSIGQLKSYRALFLRDEKPTDTIGMVILTDKINANMEFLCKTEGIKILAV
jgi:hypothetical protein